MKLAKPCISIFLTVLLIFSSASCTELSSELSVSSSETTAPSEVPLGTETFSPDPALSPIEDNLAGKVLNEFNLEVTLDADQHQLAVIQSLAYHNNAGTALSEIYFNLIPNAFMSQGGGIDMNSVIASNTATTLQQVKETVYKIDLPTPLQVNETLDIQMEYTVHIPNIQNRFGYQDNVYNVGNFIVTPAVYGANGWAVLPYVHIGDAFHTDIANYTVTIDMPEGYTVAATGTQTTSGHFHAEKVRDFAFCANNEFEILSQKVDNTIIHVYFSDDMSKTANRVMKTSERALSLFNELLGEYPYETLSVVLSGMTNGVSGMEYPTLVMIGPDITLEKFEEEQLGGETDKNGYLVIIDRVVIHEIAHQWFYGIVGNDQVSHPWLDEGFCRFSEYLYEETYPLEQPQPDFIYSLATFFSAEYEYIVSSEDGMDFVDLNLSLYDWLKGPEAYGMIYYKSASMLYHMEQEMGDVEFKKALREYVDTFAYDFVTPESFKQFWNEREDFSELFSLYSLTSQ